MIQLTNTTIHVKIKPADVKSSTYIGFDKKNSKESPKFIVGDHVSISKYKNIFAKGYMLNWSEEVFVVTKVKNTLQWTRNCWIFFRKRTAQNKSTRINDRKTN